MLNGLLAISLAIASGYWSSTVLVLVLVCLLFVVVTILSSESVLIVCGGAWGIGDRCIGVIGVCGLLVCCCIGDM